MYHNYFSEDDATQIMQHNALQEALPPRYTIRVHWLRDKSERCILTVLDSQGRLVPFRVAESFDVCFTDDTRRNIVKACWKRFLSRGE